MKKEEGTKIEKIAQQKCKTSGYILVQASEPGIVPTYEF
jgi:hypothetical protein